MDPLSITAAGGPPCPGGFTALQNNYSAGRCVTAGPGNTLHRLQMSSWKFEFQNINDIYHSKIKIVIDKIHFKTVYCTYIRTDLFNLSLIWWIFLDNPAAPCDLEQDQVQFINKTKVIVVELKVCWKERNRGSGETR